MLKTALIWQGGRPIKQYIVELTSEERSQLQQIVAKGNTTGYRIVNGGVKVRRVADQKCGTQALFTALTAGCQTFFIS